MEHHLVPLPCLLDGVLCPGRCTLVPSMPRLSSFPNWRRQALAHHLKVPSQPLLLQPRLEVYLCSSCCLLSAWQRQKLAPGHPWCMQGVTSCASAIHEGLLPCSPGWLSSQALLPAHFCQQLLKLLLLLLLQSHDLLLPSIHGCCQVFNVLPASTRLFQSRHHKIHHGPDALASSLQLALELLPILQLLCHLHLQGAGIPTQASFLAAGEADVQLQLQTWSPT